MRSAFAVACVPVAVALVIFAARTRHVPLSGDEPHYLIMADSIASDFDLDLQNNYLSDFDSRRIMRDSLFPVAMRRWLPSYYFWDFSSFWTYGPNIVAVAVVITLLVAGARASAGPRASAAARDLG
jgi:hypothetical protein